jgi:hypothetical protein
MEVPIFEVNRICYNFTRLHEGLDGGSPAEMAGMVITGWNRWMELLKKSIEKTV